MEIRENIENEKINMENKEEKKRIDIVKKKKRERKIDVEMQNQLGLGGKNEQMVMRR